MNLYTCLHHSTFSRNRLALLKRFLAAVVAICICCFASARTIVAQAERPAHVDSEYSASEVHPGTPDEDKFEGIFDPPRRPSRNILVWLVSALGWKYVIGLPLSGLLSVALALVVVGMGKGPSVGVTLQFIVPLPLLLGIIGMLENSIPALLVLTCDGTLHPPKVAEGLGTGMVAVLIGMIMMAPAYLVATVGLLIRSLKGGVKDQF